MLALAYIMLNFTKLMNLLNPKTNETIIANRELEYVAIAIIAFMTLTNLVAMVRISYKKIMLSMKKKKAQK